MCYAICPGIDLAGPEFRKLFENGKRMNGNWKKPVRIIGLGTALLALAGCSAAESIPYPKFSSVKRITKRVLTREEKDEAIRELTAEQQRHQKQAKQATQ